MELHTLSQRLFGFTLHRHVHRHLRDHFIPHEGNGHRPHVLHHRALFLYSILLVTAKLTILASPLLLPYQTVSSLAVTPENILTLTNQSRQNANLSPFISSPQLAVAATNKARDMMSKGYFAHTSPEGVSPWYWIVQSGYGYSVAGENLAIRFTTAEGVNAAWLASASHRANILSSDFKEIGIAVLTDNFGQEGPATVVVQMFGAPSEEKASEQTAPASASIVLPVSQSVFQPAEKSAVKISKTRVVPAPEIFYPLSDSFVNKSRFKIIGRAEVGETALIYIDDSSFGEIAIPANAVFEFMLPEAQKLNDGHHILYAQAKLRGGEVSERSQAVSFNVDTQPPQITKEKFLFAPALGKEKTYQVNVATSGDSIRTLVVVGSDSAVLEKKNENEWEGQIYLYNAIAGQSLPVEILVQDLAGNESRERVAWLSDGQVQGVFNALGAGEEPSQELSLFAGLVKIPDADKYLKNFYLYFVVFLTTALILKIAIKRHIQHPKTIAATSGVIMLAMVLFVL